MGGIPGGTRNPMGGANPYNSDAPGYSSSPSNPAGNAGGGVSAEAPGFVLPKTPVDAPSAAPAALNAEDPAVVAARDAATAEAQRPKGRAANVLTGGAGLLSSPSLARRTLLGS